MSENKEPIFIGFEKGEFRADRLEKKNKKKNVIVTIILCLLFLVIGFAGGTLYVLNVHPTNKADATNTLGEIEGVLQKSWIYAKDYDNLQSSLEDKAFYGMTSFADDPYTTYMSNQELQEFANGINMDYVGIGVQYRMQNGLALVERVFVNSPAEKAGILPGDIIAKVDGQSVEDLESEEIKALVLGEEGTEVVITVLRDNKEIELTAIRSPIDNSVYCYTQDNYVVMELSSFGNTTGKECMNYLDEYSDYKNIIIDLRNNTGGYQTSVKEIAGLFIGNGKVYLKQEDAKGNMVDDLTECVKTYDNFEKIILLVNNNTASAAEVFTICLKEQLDNVTIVGDTTYGKGVIQTTHYLANGGVLKYTSYNWYSPNGISIHKTGIKPDYEVRLSDIYYEYYLDMAEDEKYEYDSVSAIVAVCQKALSFLDYDIDRTDGYFDNSFKEALIAYKTEKAMNDVEVLDYDSYNSIMSDAILELSSIEKDYQFKKAIELIQNN